LKAAYAAVALNAFRQPRERYHLPEVERWDEHAQGRVSNTSGHTSARQREIRVAQNKKSTLIIPDQFVEAVLPDYVGGTVAAVRRNGLIFYK
jgi:hypothetical protein